METNENILSKIKQAVHEITPEAKVILFGSRATGNIHEESDWDILVLTREKKEKRIKKEIQKKLYPISLSIDAFISLIFTSFEEWENNPAYYSLRKSIAEDYKLI
jgi:predicted nucleotidyltransferase